VGRLPLSTAGAPQGWGRWLLVRRSLRTGELAYYVCGGPAGLPLVALVRVAGTRWRVEIRMPHPVGLGSGEVALDQVRGRRGPRVAPAQARPERRRRWQPTSPAERISRATRLRPTFTPQAICSSA
jgi:hypothetical protein